MQLTKKQPKVDNVLISQMEVGTIFRFKSSRTLEEDIVNSEIFMKTSVEASNEELTNITGNKFSFIRLGNKCELLHRQGPFIGSQLTNVKTSTGNQEETTELSKCTFGDIITFEYYKDSNFLLIHDPVDDKGFATLIALDSKLRATGEKPVKMDKSTPCIRREFLVEIQ